MIVKSLDQIREKWTRVVAQRAPDYQAGIDNPRKDWATATEAAEASFDAGIQAAVADKRFGKGVKKAGTSKWQKGAREKGVARWPAGVAVAGPEFEKGFGPYHKALETATLPPRRARRDPGNLQRVNKVVEVMIQTATKEAGK